MLASIVVILTSIVPILVSIVTILVSFEAILKSFSIRINFNSKFQSNDLPQAFQPVTKVF